MQENKTTKIGDSDATVKRLLLPELSREFSVLMDEANITLDDMLAGLAEERQAIFLERYGFESNRLGNYERQNI
jgi:hypothetical protein